jgi:polysaccharide export outer membrane protein
MFMRFPKIVVAFLLLLIVSCASKKNLVYFQGVDEIEESVNTDYTPVLRADDQLSITVTALDPIAAVPFNTFKPMLAVNGQSELEPYLIAKNGTIEFPQLGTLHIAGFTRVEVVAMLKKKLAPFLVKPNVNIQLLNFTVTVLGEVKRPGAYQVKKERITVLDAIGLAGDLNIHGTRNNVLVIRETETGKVFERIDLTSSKMFDSPAYYLVQNDVVYIEPNKPKINSSATSATTGVWISITSLVITIIALIY